MKVHQLIAKLSEYDPNLDVMIDGYEGGLQEKIYISVDPVERDVNVGCRFQGPHEFCPQSEYKVLCLNRND